MNNKFLYIYYFIVFDYNDFRITYDICLKLILLNHNYHKIINPVLN